MQNNSRRSDRHVVLPTGLQKVLAREPGSQAVVNTGDMEEMGAEPEVPLAAREGASAEGPPTTTTTATTTTTLLASVKEQVGFAHLACVCVCVCSPAELWPVCVSPQLICHSVCCSACLNITGILSVSASECCLLPVACFHRFFFLVNYHVWCRG